MAALAGGALLPGPIAVAAVPVTGGATAVPSSGEGGGAEYGAPIAPTKPAVASRFEVTPRTLTAGRTLPKVTLRIDQAGVPTVVARMVLWPAGGKGRAVDVALGSVRTGQVLHPSWPRGTRLTAGRWTARVHVTDPAGQALKRTKAEPGLVALSVRTPPKPKPKPVAKPKPAPKPAAPKPTPASTPKPATPAVPAAGLIPGVFPVAGAHTYGDLFGAARTGYGHQGVDLLAPTGTPIVAPAAGTVRFTDYQASAAGEYVVLHLDAGPDLFFAHCIRHSTKVPAGARVAAGAPLCALGATGDATGPHLHFELWPNGWRTGAKNSLPADPLAQLKAWDR